MSRTRFGTRLFVSASDLAGERVSGDEILTAPERGALDTADIDRLLLGAARRMRRPRLLIDGECRVLWASPDAVEILQPPLPLTVTKGKLCTSAGGERGRAWTAFVDQAGEQEGCHYMPGEVSGSWVLARAWAERHRDNRVVFVECIPSIPLQSVERCGLAEEFELTRSECSVLDLFSRLLRPDEIAQQLGVSLSTVRSHLKQIHAKLGVNSSVQLLRIAGAFCDR